MPDAAAPYDLAGIRAATTEPHLALVARATEVLRADERVLAAWLVGSFANGDADPFSDVDIRCAVADEAYEDLRTSWRSLVDAIAPTVSVRPLGGQAGGVCVTPEWLHFDLVVYLASSADVAEVLPLFDRAGLLPAERRAQPVAVGEPFYPAGAVEMFLYMLGNMVAVAGRDELVPGMNGVAMVRDIALVGLLLAENGITTLRDPRSANPFPFTKRLRGYLTAEQNALLASLPPLAPTTQSVVESYVALARAFLPRARALAERTGAEWPEAYERATVAYFERMTGARL
jgi:predicted nucleotidyltransferase